MINMVRIFKNFPCFLKEEKVFLEETATNAEKNMKSMIFFPRRSSTDTFYNINH